MFSTGSMSIEGQVSLTWPIGMELGTSCVCIFLTLLVLIKL